MHYDQELDTSGMNCPLPILHTKRILSTMTKAQILRIICTDPGSVKDFEAFARQTGNKIVEFSERDGKYYYTLEKN